MKHQRPVTLRTEILRLLFTSDAGIKASDIKRRLVQSFHTTEKTVAAELSKLKQQGLVQNERYGYWTLTPDGQRQANPSPSNDSLKEVARFVDYERVDREGRVRLRVTILIEAADPQSCSFSELPV